MLLILTEEGVQIKGLFPDPKRLLKHIYKNFAAFMSIKSLHVLSSSVEKKNPKNNTQAIKNFGKVEKCKTPFFKG